MERQKQLAIIETAAKRWLKIDNMVVDGGEYSAAREYSKEVDELLNAVEKHKLNATQEEWPQIACLIEKVKQLYLAVADRFVVVDKICLAFSFLVHWHSKNHKCDAMLIISNIKLKTAFKCTFKSYDTVLKIMAPKASSMTWMDVYHKYTFAKLHIISILLSSFQSSFLFSLSRALQLHRCPLGSWNQTFILVQSFLC